MSTKKPRLSILDQSIVHTGFTAKQAVESTIATAKLADQLGYHRFWISEHHNSAFIAGSAPEILMVKLGMETTRIRIGSGGIMMPNHSTLKVAENLRMLELLFPGRVDLGMGRAPGTDRITSALLNPSNNFSEADYILQLEHLQHYFNDTAGTKYGPVIASPQFEGRPQQWILSSSGGSARIAAGQGMGLAIAKFINGAAAPAMVQEYRNNFIASADLDTPTELLAIAVLCADTEEKAADMRKYMDYILVQFEKGKFDHYPDYEIIMDYTFTAEEALRIQSNSGRVISGTQQAVKEQLQQLATDFDINEIMISCMAYYQHDRIRSFELIAEAFNLS